MSCKVFKKIQCLDLIPVDYFARFVRFGAAVEMSLLLGKNKIPSLAIPGTITCTEAAKGESLTKAITFEVAGGSPEVAERLQRLSVLRIVAVYVDEGGRSRVCGSPSYPLSLSYSSDGSGYSVTLSGQDLVTDGYV